VIDLLSILARYSLAHERLANGPGELGQCFEIVERQYKRVIFDEKEPIATPGNVAGHWPKSRHVDGHISSQPVTRNICDLDCSILFEGCNDNADGRFDAMPTWSNAIEIGERGDDADRSVTAHPEVTDIVEKDDARGAGTIEGSA
jgi:hypothetical protein